MRFLVLVAMPVALAACSRGDAPVAGEAGDEPQIAATRSAIPTGAVAMPDPDPATVRIALDGEGVRFIAAGGRSSLLSFGSDRGRAEEAVAGVLGAVDNRSDLAECPAGPLAFSDYGAFDLVFQNDKFVGWSLQGSGDGARLTTVDGVGLSSELPAIEDTRTVELVEGSTLGREFTSGGISGLLDDGAGVTNLWAGTVCNFR